MGELTELLVPAHPGLLHVSVREAVGAGERIRSGGVGGGGATALQFHVDRERVALLTGQGVVHCGGRRGAMQELLPNYRLF